MELGVGKLSPILDNRAVQMEKTKNPALEKE